MMTEDDHRPEPRTVPPPKGSKDMYSAPTRIGTLPEEVLAALRAEATDASVAARTSPMEAAALERARPPAEPAALAPCSEQRPALAAFTEQPALAAFTEQQPSLATFPEHPPALAAFPEHPPLFFDPAPREGATLAIHGQWPRAGLLGAVIVVAVFAALGGLLAVALTLP